VAVASLAPDAELARRQGGWAWSWSTACQASRGGSNHRAGVGMTTESLARDGRGAALRDRSGHSPIIISKGRRTPLARMLESVMGRAGLGAPNQSRSPSARRGLQPGHPAAGVGHRGGSNRKTASRRSFRCRVVIGIVRRRPSARSWSCDRPRSRDPRSRAASSPKWRVREQRKRHWRLRASFGWK
jgi:hypothetical protein